MNVLLTYHAGCPGGFEVSPKSWHKFLPPCVTLLASPFLSFLFASFLFYFHHQLSWFDQKLKSLKRETTAGNSGVMFLSELERTGLKPKDDQESERLEPMGGARGQRLCICSLESSWVWLIKNTNKGICICSGVCVVSVEFVGTRGC